jgi:hypothetical protein
VYPRSRPPTAGNEPHVHPSLSGRRLLAVPGSGSDATSSAHPGRTRGLVRGKRFGDRTPRRVRSRETDRTSRSGSRDGCHRIGPDVRLRSTSSESRCTDGRRCPSACRVAMPGAVALLV